MKRKGISRRKASKSFKRHANGTKKINYNPPLKPGGIRL